MSIGNSGRIVIEIPVDKKRVLYGELSRNGMSLKGWFLDQVDEYLQKKKEPNSMEASSAEGKSSANTEKSGKLKPAVNDSQRKRLDASQTDELISSYESLEKKYPVRVLSADVSYVSPVNFVESMRLPRHRWFPYKEGFSPTFVQTFISEFSQTRTGTVFDPFSGVGTTGLVASKMGFNAVGLDVSPMATFIAKAKATQLEKKELTSFSDYINGVKHSSLIEEALPPNNETVKSYFEEDYLSAILAIRCLVDAAPTKKIEELALLAFLTLVEDFSTHRKAGNGVKRKTRFEYRTSNESARTKVRNAFVEKLFQMGDDLAEDFLPSIPNFRTASCIGTDEFKNLGDIDVALTSPPYANCFDYSKIYMRELWLGGFFKSTIDQAEFRKNSIRSHVHATWTDRNIAHGSEIAERMICPRLESQELWSKKIPGMISGYFKDIGALLHMIQPKMRKGASFGIVVGNSVYGGISVATDLLIADIAHKVGFEVVRIDVYRGVIPSSQQYALIGDKRWARESTVILKKK